MSKETRVKLCISQLLLLARDEGLLTQQGVKNVTDTLYLELGKVY